MTLPRSSSEPLPSHQSNKRIWPLDDLLGVLPHHVVLSEDEEGPVDGEAVLAHRDWVVQCHGARALCFGLLKSGRDAPRGETPSIPDPVQLGASIPGAQQARDLVSKPGHSGGKEEEGKGGEKKEVIDSWEAAGRGAETGFSPSSALLRRKTPVEMFRNFHIGLGSKQTRTELLRVQ